MTTERDFVPTSSHFVPDEVPVPTGDFVPFLVPPVGDEDEVAGTGRSSRKDQKLTSSGTKSRTTKLNPDAQRPGEMLDHGGQTRGAHLDRCDRCAADILVGLDADRCALFAICDPIALDHLGEYLALFRGLRTYTLARRMGGSGQPRWEIDPRSHWGIAKRSRRYPVIPAHRCGIVHSSTRGSPFVRPAAPAVHDSPPF